MKKVILANIIILLALLVILEVSLSAAFYMKDVKNPLILSKYVTDFPYVYYDFKPYNNENNFIANEDGLYSPYHRDKPAGAIRIMLIGGSTARGMMASDYEKTISANLERLLKKEFPRNKIEVVNAGMSGYVVEQLFIYYQLVLSKYNPDIVIGLNGYNDLMSVKINRHSRLYFSPQNMRQFMVIADGKSRSSFLGRVSAIFPGTFRLLDFAKRSAAGKSQYDYSAFTPAEVDKAKSDYLGIIRDIHALCAANGTVHIEFLQPVKWYVKGDRDASIGMGAVPQLVDLYASYEKGLSRTDYGYSITDLFRDKPGIFLDDCHVPDAGNELTAIAMLVPIKAELTKIIKNKDD